MKTLITVSCVIAFMFCAVAYAQAQEIAGEEVVAASASASGVVTCQKGDLSRTIEIVYTGVQGEAPCEVHYKKITEEPGHDQILWNAAHEKGYCETKQQEFKAKLEGMGWTCQ